MITQSILLALTLFATLSPPTAPTDKDDQPKTKVVKDSFCCDRTTKGDGKGGGEGCVLMNKSDTDSCSAAVHCAGNYTLQDGTLTCF